MAERKEVPVSRVVDNPEEYFRSRLPPQDPLLVRLEKEAAAEGIPIIGPVAGRLLQMLAGISGATRILEFGCATGYSAIHLARGSADAGGKVITVERRADMARRAAGNFAEAGCAEQVELLQADAFAALPSLEGPFDVVFLDLDKALYIDLLPHCGRLLRPGGLLVADNSSFTDAAPFVDALGADDRWETLHLYSFLPGHSPEWDAITLARRRGGEG